LGQSGNTKMMISFSLFMFYIKIKWLAEGTFFELHILVSDRATVLAASPNGWEYSVKKVCGPASQAKGDLLRTLFNFNDAAVAESDEEKPGAILDPYKIGNIAGEQNWTHLNGSPDTRVDRQDPKTGL